MTAPRAAGRVVRMTRYLLALALLVAACGTPTTSGELADAAPYDRPTGWAPSGQTVLGPAECMPGILACQRRYDPRLPPAPDADWFCISPVQSGNCGACGNRCAAGCHRNDAGVPTCDP